MSTYQQRDQWVNEHLGLVKKIAGKIARRLPAHVEVEDLIQEGVVGLLKMSHEDASGSYVASRVTGSILDALRRQDWVSRGGRQRTRQVQQAQEHLRQSAGRSPSSSELAAYTGLSPRQLENIRAESKRATLVSWEELHSQGDLKEPSAAPKDAVDVEDLQILLRRLPERERRILTLHYFEDRKMGEIARGLELSQARLSQLHKQALRRLQDMIAPPPPRVKRAPFERAAFLGSLKDPRLLCGGGPRKPGATPCAPAVPIRFSR